MFMSFLDSLDFVAHQSVHADVNNAPSLRELVDLYLLRCEVEGKSPRTVVAYRGTLARFLRAVDIEHAADVTQEPGSESAGRCAEERVADVVAAAVGHVPAAWFPASSVATQSETGASGVPGDSLRGSVRPHCCHDCAGRVNHLHRAGGKQCVRRGRRHNAEAAGTGLASGYPMPSYSASISAMLRGSRQERPDWLQVNANATRATGSANPTSAPFP